MSLGESVHQIHPSESLNWTNRNFLLFVQFKAVVTLKYSNFHMVRGGIHTGQVANLLQV